MHVTEIKNLQALFPDEGEITPVTFYKNIMIFKTWTHLIIFDVISKRYVSVDNLNEIPSQCFGEYVLFESGKIQNISEYLAECSPQEHIDLDRTPDMAAGELKFNQILPKFPRL